MEKVKKEYLIFREYEIDGGFGDAVPRSDFLFAVYATQEEIEGFIEEWHKPYVYDTPYRDLTCHGVYALEVEPVNDISRINNLWLEDQLHFPDWNWERKYNEEDEQ